MCTALRPEFTVTVPDDLEEGVLYVSMTYATAIHLCACGCGEEVVTPISPGDWQLTYDGEEVSLTPSIGNWRLPCRSHYWVRSGRVEWVADSGFAPSRIEEPPTDDESAGGVLTRIGRRLASWLRCT